MPKPNAPAPFDDYGDASTYADDLVRIEEHGSCVHLIFAQTRNDAHTRSAGAKGGSSLG